MKANLVDTPPQPLLQFKANGHMTAAVLYGSEDLKIERIDIPQLAPDEALVRVKVALTCGTDLKVWKRGYHARMIMPPAVFGHELCRSGGKPGRRREGRVPPGGPRGSVKLRALRRVPVLPQGTQPICAKTCYSITAPMLSTFEYRAVLCAKTCWRFLRTCPFSMRRWWSRWLACFGEFDETGIQPGDTAVLIGCGPIGLKFIRMLACRGVNVIALGKRPNQIKSAERMGARAAFDVSKLSDPVQTVRRLTEGGRGADSVIEAVGQPITWEWAVQMVRCGGTVNLFGGCPQGAKVHFDPTALHYSEITIKSTFHHTPRFIREALASIARGEICAHDFVNAEIPLRELPSMFEHMKNRNGEMKVAVIP